jgi:hypothetical protein
MGSLIEMLMGGLSKVPGIGSTGDASLLLKLLSGTEEPSNSQTKPEQTSQSWQKWSTPQDTSAGMSAFQTSNPMYDQMMQQSMQGQTQQSQRQPMVPTGVQQMPTSQVQMPGTSDRDTVRSLMSMLSGGVRR